MSSCLRSSQGGRQECLPQIKDALSPAAPKFPFCPKTTCGARAVVVQYARVGQSARPFCVHSRRTSMSRVATPPQTQPTTTNQVKVPHEKIAMRAYEKWCKRGRPQGTDKQDWYEAERELRAELRSPRHTLSTPTRR